MFSKEYLTYFDRLLLSNELLDKQSKLKGEATWTWLEQSHRRPPAPQHIAVRRHSGGSNHLFYKLGDPSQKAESYGALQN